MFKLIFLCMFISPRRVSNKTEQVVTISKGDDDDVDDELSSSSSNKEAW
jgi:hypothetical protein